MVGGAHPKSYELRITPRTAWWAEVMVGGAHPTSLNLIAYSFFLVPKLLLGNAIGTKALLWNHSR